MARKLKGVLDYQSLSYFFPCPRHSWTQSSASCLEMEGEKYQSRYQSFFQCEMFSIPETAIWKSAASGKAPLSGAKWSLQGQSSLTYADHPLWKSAAFAPLHLWHLPPTLSSISRFTCYVREQDLALHTQFCIEMWTHIGRHMSVAATVNAHLMSAHAGLTVEQTVQPPCWTWVGAIRQPSALVLVGVFPASQCYWGCAWDRWSVGLQGWGQPLSGTQTELWSPGEGEML